MSSLLNQDFGSESEGDDFNPAPASDSDNEAGGDAEDGTEVRQDSNGNQQRQRSAGGRADVEGEDPTPRANGQQRNSGTKDEDGVVGDLDNEIKDTAVKADSTVGGEDGEEDDDEEDEADEDDDEEDAVVVSSPDAHAFSLFLTVQTGASTEKGSETSPKSIS